MHLVVTPALRTRYLFLPFVVAKLSVADVSFFLGPPSFLLSILLGVIVACLPLSSHGSQAIVASCLKLAGMRP